MALSLAISGQRDAALRVIDGQLRRHDRAAWRTQAFVLALTGDARGAEDIAGRMMPAANAQGWRPSSPGSPPEPGAKGGGGPFRPLPERRPRAPNGVPRRHPRRSRRARSGPQRQPPRRAEPAEPLNAAPRRRPGAERGPGRDLIRTPTGEEAPPVEPRPPRQSSRRTSASRSAGPGAKPEDDQPSEPQPPPSAARGARLRARRHLHPRPGGDSRRRRQSEPIAGPRRPRPDFGDVAAMVQSLPEEQAPPSARRRAPPARAPPAAARPRPRRATAGARTTPPANPARHWVQLAHAGASPCCRTNSPRRGPRRRPCSAAAPPMSPDRPRQPAAGRPVRQRARRPRLRRPARTAPCRGNCLDKPGGPGDRAAPDSE